MRNLIQRWLNSTRANSGQDAKQRLKFLLVHDEIDLSPARLEAMKTEILEVIGRYVDIEAEGVDVRLEKDEGQVALISNVPVRRVAGRPR